MDDRLDYIGDVYAESRVCVYSSVSRIATVVVAANRETILSSSIRLEPISSIAVAQDGVMNVADQGSFRIPVLELNLPQYDGNGGFLFPLNELRRVHRPPGDDRPVRGFTRRTAVERDHYQRMKFRVTSTVNI